MYAFDSTLNISPEKTSKVLNKTTPGNPTINKVTTKKETVTSKGGSEKIGQGTVDTKWNSKVKIKAQKKGSVLKLYAQDPLIRLKVELLRFFKAD